MFQKSQIWIEPERRHNYRDVPQCSQKRWARNHSRIWLWCRQGTNVNELISLLGMSSTTDHPSPEYAVALLHELQGYGLSDSAFKIIHHFGPKATIQSYYDYCREKVTNFHEDG